jgi:hypothetical protein
MGARYDVSENYALEIAAGDAVVVEKHIVAMLRETVKNGECPWDIGPAVTKEDGFLDAIHTPARKPHSEQN